MKKAWNNLQEALHTPAKVVITTHLSPDGDAMGSSLGLYHFLKQWGHEVCVIVPSAYPDFLKWMPGDSQVMIYPYGQSAANQRIKQADWIFCLDFNALSRIGEMGKEVLAAAAQKVMIDHHQEPEDFADYTFSDTTASSTCELIYRVIQGWGEEAHVGRETAICLYTGILTDTGSFQYPSTTPEVHRIVAHLMEKDINHSTIYQSIFNTFSEQRLRLFGFCINERMRLFPEHGSALIWLTREDLLQFKVKSGDTEGIVNYPLKVKGIHTACLAIDRTEFIKLSFRSQGDHDVQQLTKHHFGGGGHRNAAGGISHEPLEVVMEQVVQLFTGVTPV